MPAIRASDCQRPARPVSRVGTQQRGVEQRGQRRGADSGSRATEEVTASLHTGVFGQRIHVAFSWESGNVFVLFNCGSRTTLS